VFSGGNPQSHPDRRTARHFPENPNARSDVLWHETYPCLPGRRRPVHYRRQGTATIEANDASQTIDQVVDAFAAGLIAKGSAEL